MARRSSGENFANFLKMAGYMLLFNGFCITLLAFLTIWGVTGETQAKWHELDGLLSTTEVEELGGVELPEGPYETVAGFVLAALGRVPVLGDTVDVDGARLTVLEMDGRRIARLRLSRVPDPAGSTAAPDGSEGAGAAPSGGATAYQPGGTGPEHGGRRDDPARSGARGLRE